MSATVFSFAMAILWCDIFAIVMYVLLKRKSFIETLSVWPLVVLILMSLRRLLGIVEFQFVRILRSEKLLPVVVRFFEKQPFQNILGNIQIRVIDLFYLTWAIGSVVLFCIFLVKELRFRKEMKKGAEEPAEDLAALCKKVTGEKPIGPRILVTPATKIPMIAGVFRPVVYLPTEEYSEQELTYMLRHEWTHYKQRDVWIKLLVKLLCIVYWWNPVLYLLRYNIDFVLEVKSDLQVTGVLTESEKLDYLDTILHVVRNRNGKKGPVAPTGMALVSEGKESVLKKRFRYVLEYKGIGPLQRFGSLALSILMVICFIGSYFVVLQPYAGEPIGAESDVFYDIDRDNAYLKELPEGGYALYVEDAYVCDVKDCREAPFSELTVLGREEEKDED
ncbi:MAG: M56 family metallopeptidase [Lachnospiraceae bacterium]|nr:M56 family metallopeptidase [Lachnospiraceae bacterium]